MENVANSISIQNLVIQYDKKVILSDVNLDIEKGKVYSILGPNGSGKSSLLNCISADNRFSGEIIIEGKNLATLNRKELSLLISKIDSNNFIGTIKVKELIAMGRIPHTDFLGRLKQKDHEIIERSIQMTQVQELLEKSVHELSDGERRKVLITKALVQDCPIMLMDEPTTFLDIGNKFAFSKLLKKVNTDYNKTILFSTHDLDLAFSISDKIILIMEGKTSVWDTEKVKSEKLLEKVFAQYDVKVDENGHIKL